MIRRLGILLMAALIVAIVSTTPRSQVLHGPIVTSSDSARASGHLYAIEAIGNPVIVTGTVSAGPHSVDLPDGQAEFLVPIRISGVQTPIEFADFSLEIDGAQYWADDRVVTQPRLNLFTFTPQMWVSGTVAFRVPASVLAEANEIRLSVGQYPAHQSSLGEIVSVRLVGAVREVETYEVLAPEVVGTWSG